MTKFDMGAAWEDSVALLKSHIALTGTIAAVFLFLPALAVAWIAPQPLQPAQPSDLGQAIAAFQASFAATLPYQIAVALCAMIGTAAILRLWLARAGISVGEALTFAFTVFPTMIALQLITALMFGFAALLLIVPALYLVGRLALVSPIVADRGIYNPVEALRLSWSLTRGNGWAVFFFIFLVAAVLFIAALVIVGLTGVVTDGQTGVGRIVSGIVEAGVGAVGSLVSIAISAAAYRQLVVRGTEDVFA